MSPLLFVLVLEAFSSLMVRAESGGFLVGFSVAAGSRMPLCISHLLFADDTLVCVMQRPISYRT